MDQKNRKQERSTFGMLWRIGLVKCEFEAQERYREKVTKEVLGWMPALI
jgi:hypothetical protein